MDKTQKSPILNNNEASIFDDAKRLLSDSQKIRAAAKSLHKEAQVYREHAKKLRQMRKPTGRVSTEQALFGSFSQ